MIDYATQDVAKTVLALTGGEGADTLTGGDGNDLLTGDGNLLRNGGLEYQVANNSLVQGYASDWFNANGPIEVWGSGQSGVTAAEGSTFVELDVESAADTLYQDVQTTAGQSYTLTFSAVQRSGTTYGRYWTMALARPR